MEETILRSEVIKQMDAGDRFDLVFVTADRKRGTGGSLVTVKGWQKVIGEPYKPGKKKIHPVATNGRNPQHRENKTINIHNPMNRDYHITTVHVLLMQLFNGKRITNG